MQARRFGLVFTPAKRLGIAALAWLGVGCAAQVEANDGNSGSDGNAGNEGNAGSAGNETPEPSLPDNIGTLRGRLVGMESEPIPENTGIAVVWDWKDPIAHDLGLSFGEVVEVSGDFPFEFEIEASVPPTEELLIEMADGNSLAVARIWWVDLMGFNPMAGGGFSGYGVAENQVVVYVAKQVEPEAASARFLHATPGPGFHVFDVTRGVVPPEGCSISHIPDERGFPRGEGDCPRDTLSLAPDDLDTALDVSAGYHEITYEEIETAW